MSRTRYKFSDEYVPYFLTCTVIGWLPVFTRVEAVNIIFESWKYLQKKDNWLMFGFVIMENHLHFIAAAQDLSNGVKRFKSFTARKIIDHLLESKQAMLLSQLAFYKLKHKVESEFQFWQEGSHPQALTTDDMIEQKLEYIHNNPVRRGYVDEPCHWRYSSARCHEGHAGLLEVVRDWR